MHGLNFMLFLVSLPLLVAAIDNPLGKCSIKDNDCFKKGWENVLKVLGPTGIPEVNAAPIDPMIFNNITITILPGFLLTITDGTLKGFKDCKFDKASLDLEKKLDTRYIICDILKVKGKFSFGGTNPVLKNFFGSDSVNGHGDIKVNFDKTTMDLKLPFTVIKKEDGDTYLKFLDKKLHYTFDVQDVVFSIKHFVVGEKDISDVASEFLTSNWKSIIQPLGRPVIDKCLEFLVIFANGFYDTVPAKEFLLEDMTPYVAN